MKSKIENVILKKYISEHDSAEEYRKMKSEEYYIRNDELLCYNGESNTLSIPEGVTRFKGGVINAKIRTVKIPASVKYILMMYSRQESCMEFIVDENNQEFCDVDGVLFSKDKTVLIKYPPARKCDCYVVPDGVKRIDDCAFYECQEIGEILLPDSVEEIGYGAFACCPFLTDIHIPKTLKVCEEGAFEETPWLRGQDGYAIIGDGLLIDYRGQCEDIVIPDNVKVIAEGAFSCNVRIKSVIIPNSVTRIEARAFECCHNLESVYIPDSVTETGWEVFDECINLRNIRISENLKYICIRMFYRCINLEEFSIPDSVKFIHSGAFGRCYNLKSVSLGNSLEEIAPYAFYHCKSLKEITIPDSVEKVTKKIFSSCNEVKVSYRGNIYNINGMGIINDTDIL